jgi:hypothetical protein
MRASMHHTELEIMALRLERERDISQRRLEEARHLRERNSQVHRTEATGRGVLHIARQFSNRALRGFWLWPAPRADARAREPIPIGAEHGAPIATA